MLKSMDEVDVQYYDTLIKPQAHALMKVIQPIIRQMVITMEMQKKTLNAELPVR